MSYIWLSWSNLDGELTSVQQVYVNSTISLFYFVGMVPLLLLVIMLHMTITSSHSLVTHVTLNNTSTIFFFFFKFWDGPIFFFFFWIHKEAPILTPSKKFPLIKDVNPLNLLGLFLATAITLGNQCFFPTPQWRAHHQTIEVFDFLAIHL